MPEEIFSFYILCGGIALALTSFFALKRNGAMIRRGLTILLLLHVLVAILWAGKSACIAFAFVLCGICTFEVTQHSIGRGGAIVAALFSCAAAALYSYSQEIWDWVLWGWLALVTATFAVPYSRLSTQIWALLFGLVIVPAGCAALMRLAAPVPVLWMVLILLVQFNDTLSLLVGRVRGNTRPFPRLSPNKSVEGYIGGAAGITLALVIAASLFGDSTAWAGYSSSVITVGIVSWIATNLGDLLFSKFKRAHSIKDFSALLPGHGGIVDRFDSLLFLAPVAWVVF